MAVIFDYAEIRAAEIERHAKCPFIAVGARVGGRVGLQPDLQYPDSVGGQGVANRHRPDFSRAAMSRGEPPARFHCAMPELFPFKFFDPIRGRWVQARYKATREEIAARYQKWEITGPGWTPNPVGGSFVPIVASENSGRPPLVTARPDATI